MTFLSTLLFRYNFQRKLEKIEEDKNEIAEAQKAIIDNLTKLHEEKSKNNEILQQETA